MLQELKTSLGEDANFTSPVQERIASLVARGDKHLIIRAPPNCGKTLAHILTLNSLPPNTFFVWVTPFRVLGKSVLDECKRASVSAVMYRNQNDAFKVVGSNHSFRVLIVLPKVSRKVEAFWTF